MDARRRRAVPIALVLLVVLVALVLIATAHWRRGAFVLGGAAATAMVLRLVLSTDAAGVLAVRGRWFDVSFYLGCAALLIVLADGTV
ncbi:DUF3017 domain-containing protein [Nakamurella flavida]|uniref:DUF3017 domain-containing protein n=1 Tax=Nakamurella flavida TaxID=363630 RepID=A0A938YPA0_9ACTN|nr:DUF3017 domain-containing protein [Nakamurella flavida]MBM9475942.1 DUF3017 domain-containing protein [Nakamurella flavida]MBM9478398.1 DUF3017 domain-containing protein [Nakamurella flavida]MDP9777770.1 putative membrane protein [Nakamurella flavida]